MDIGLLVTSVVVFVLGGWLAAFPERQTRHIEARMAAGDDRHFEEQRYYRAHPNLRNPKAVRRNGVVLMTLAAIGVGIAIIA